MTTSDFTFAWEHAASPDGPWGHLSVVRFRGREELSALYRYDLVLLARAPAAEIDPHDLAGARATLRIATLTAPAYKLVHGVIVEAEELGPVPEGMLYRAVLMPPLVRARHRTRCRIFLEKTTRQIVDAVLQGDPNLTLDPAPPSRTTSASRPRFTPAAEKLAWRIADPSRIDDARVRAHCVQYNESDLAFVARLLEDEGLSYHVENGAGLCLLVISDSDEGKARLDPFDALGPAVAARHVGAAQARRAPAGEDGAPRRLRLAQARARPRGRGEGRPRRPLRGALAGRLRGRRRPSGSRSHRRGSTATTSRPSTRWGRVDAACSAPARSSASSTRRTATTASTSSPSSTCAASRRASRRCRPARSATCPSPARSSVRGGAAARRWRRRASGRRGPRRGRASSARRRRS